MYAVIKTGGKQYKVAKDDKIVIEKIAGETGASVSLDEVLLVGDDKSQTVGVPLVKGASVTATVLDQKRDKKIIVFKKKRRKNYRRKNGHRQDITILQITDILTGAKKKAAPKKKAEKTEAPAAAKTDAAADTTEKTEE
jgi:large subunit ribosomal protein L21